MQEAASNMVEKAFGSFADFLNFMCYNICVQIDISYYKCIQFFYTSHELQENILSLSNDYFATLLNLVKNLYLFKLMPYLFIQIRWKTKA